MPIQVIAMLTNNDLTVPDAMEVFEQNQDSRVRCWGFKDIGIDVKDGAKLVAKMKAAGKTTFLEPLVEEEEKCLSAARFAVECGFDYLIGMAFHNSAWEILQQNGVQYLPTCGRRAGLPRMLYGTPRGIAGDAYRILDYGVDGVCLSVYRYKDGDPEEMARRFVRDLGKPFIVCGGINSRPRLDFLREIRPWGFTIGSALFGDSLEGTTIREKLDRIDEYLNRPAPAAETPA